MTGRVTHARAWANNEVAYVAWDVDEVIAGCLGFDVVRVYLNTDGSVVLRPDGTEDRTSCASWLPFEGQSNPRWLPQDTTVWPVQKNSWRDLTLRKRRDGMARRPDEVRVRYEIRPVGMPTAGRDMVEPTGQLFQSIPKLDARGRPVLDADGTLLRERVRAYEGTPRPLAWLGPPVITNDVVVTRRRGAFVSTFTNGILAAQWLRRVLEEDGVIRKGELLHKLETPGDPHRAYLSGDVLPVLRDLFAEDGEFYLALYELDDPELVDLLVAKGDRIHVILSNTSAVKGIWDARNAPARARLVAAGVDIQHRLFNNSVHIGHNKFAVHVSAAGEPRAVLTGSTNWTSTGLAGQTNNLLLVEDREVAAIFLDQWRRLHEDALPVPGQPGATMSASRQGKTLRAANAVSQRVTMASGGQLDIWFSPNRPQRKKPTSALAPPPLNS